MSDTTQRIKEKLGITDVLSSYIKLEKAGKNFKARCPFHHEKTASFFVSPERDSYYCFGCGAHGDIFSFVEQFEGLDFTGALKVLAERAGIELQHVSYENKEQHARLYALLAEATAFFERHLSLHEDVQKYLIGRGLSEKTIQSFRLGFIEGPEQGSWRALHDHLINKKFTVQEIERAGLIKKTTEPRAGGSGYYDVFRSRIMFPLFDTSGRVIAFSGRSFGDVRDDAPKYVNSPETPLFKKSSVLYGLDRAKMSIRKYDFTILVEGQFDLLLAHQAGFSNTVAVSGTALTVDHIDRLARLSKNIVIALDSDAAGIASTLKSSRVALEAGMDVKVAAFPEGKDPADVIAENVEIWKTAIRTATHIVEFLLDTVGRSQKDARAFKKEVRNSVLPFLSLIGNKIDRTHFVGVIAKRLGVDESIIEEEARSVAFAEPVYVSDTVVEEKREIVDRKTRLIKQIATYIRAQKDTELARTSHETIKKLLGYDPLNDAAGNERDVFMLEEALGEFGTPDIHLQEMLFSLQEEILKERYADAREGLLRAEQEHDEKKGAEYLALCGALSKELSALRLHRNE